MAHRFAQDRDPEPGGSRGLTIAAGALAWSATSGCRPWRRRLGRTRCGFLSRGQAPMGSADVGQGRSRRLARGCRSGRRDESFADDRKATSRPVGRFGESTGQGLTSTGPHRSISWSELSSLRVISMPGCARRNAARASNSGVTVHAVTMATTSRPRISPVDFVDCLAHHVGGASAARACSRAAARRLSTWRYGRAVDESPRDRVRVDGSGR